MYVRVSIDSFDCYALTSQSKVFTVVGGYVRTGNMKYTSIGSPQTQSTLSNTVRQKSAHLEKDCNLAVHANINFQITSTAQSYLHTVNTVLA